ncbi:acyl carrier protein [Flavobacterium aquiphilum]|uniref:acyl carrier protein n=1 Tax=Flavobacterium aquiphilum TaxID=3003261 RepID=UPI002480124D|nr:acyl carrier protein [Flavobacterium aquiphilum]
MISVKNNIDHHLSDYEKVPASFSWNKIASDREPPTLKPNENISERLRIDSFDALQFIIALNEKLGIEIPEKDYGKTNIY